MQSTWSHTKEKVEMKVKEKKRQEREMDKGPTILKALLSLPYIVGI